MKTINIDFNNKADKVYKVERIILSNNKNNRRFFFGLISRDVNISYHSIAIRDLRIAGELEVDHPERLVRLQCLQEGKELEGTVLQDISITSNEFFIEVLFDEAEILDCNALNDHYEGQISFNVEFQPKPQASKRQHNISLDISCSRAESDLYYELFIDKSYKDGREYKGVKDTEVGHVEVRCQSKYNFAVPVESCKLKIWFDDFQIKENISWGRTQKAFSEIEGPLQ